MFRTWSATVLACRVLRRAPSSTSGGGAHRRAVRDALDLVAEALGNTPAVARRSYIHPAVLEAYAEGAIDHVSVDAGWADEGDPVAGGPPRWTGEDEAATIALLRRPVRRGRGRRARRAKTTATAA
jgi:DNA topoisomerase-1